MGDSSLGSINTTSSLSGRYSAALQMLWAEPWTTGAREHPYPAAVDDANAAAWRHWANGQTAGAMRSRFSSAATQLAAG